MTRRLSLILCSIALVNLSGFVSAPNPAVQHLVYVSPMPGAQNISPGTSIAISAAKPLSTASLHSGLFTVEGSSSGTHSGKLRLSDDSLTLLFYPDKAFDYGERVQVSIGDGVLTRQGEKVSGKSFEFSTIDRPFSQFPALPPEPMAADLAPSVSPKAANASPYITYPEFTNIMPVTVTVPASSTAPGSIFFANIGFVPTYDPSLFILNDSGEPVFLQKEPPGYYVTDFKKQTVGGVPYLTYHVGTPAPTWSNGTFYQMDQSYKIVDTWTIGNGYGADEHEMLLLDNGHAIMESYIPLPYDLSPYGGPVDGILVDTLIQEQDSNKNVVFEWHASQHTPITSTLVDLSNYRIDYFHTNAIEVDTDGNLLVSQRTLSNIVKIDRTTGDVIWRLGGKLGQFTFTNDAGFSFQHDIRRLPNGHITIFDNGSWQMPEPYSRAVEYALDENAMTATRVWQYPEDKSVFAPFMGNAQRLENGNTIIGWGILPRITEVDPAGNLAWRLDMGGLSYRAFRFTWDALPAEPPRLIVQGNSDPTSANLHFAWNGATQIDAYEVYAGPTITATSLITTVATTGFETSAILKDLDPSTCIFQVHPVQHAGASTPMSNLAYRPDIPECLAKLPYQYHLPRVEQKSP